MKTPLIKKPLRNDQPPFAWEYGKPDTNIILEQKALAVQFLRYEILSADGRRLYDTLSFKESPNNTVVLVRNQKQELGLLWEWRPIPEKWFWACPRGFGDPDDEDNLATAKREMIEEIGNCKVIHSKKIGSLYANTTFFESPVGLVLLDVEETEAHISQEEGIADFKFYPREELLRMIREDKVEDTFTLSALMRYFALEGV
ncbi:MAG: NUDIX domain-containing protein [Anaerolineales bacterium]